MRFSESLRTIFLQKTSSHPEVFYKIGALKNCAKLAGKHLCQSLVFNKVAAATLLNKRLWHSVFLFTFNSTEM